MWDPIGDNCESIKVIVLRLRYAKSDVRNTGNYSGHLGTVPGCAEHSTVGTAP